MRPKGKGDIGRRKPTQIELVQRISDVLELLVAYQKQNDIVRYAVETWKISPHTAENYIYEARKILRQSSVIDRDANIAQGIEVRKKIIRQALEEQNLMQAGMTQADLDRLLGNYATVKSEIEIKAIHAMTKEELLVEQESLKQKLLELN